MNMLRNKFFKWCASSLTGHLILFETFAGTPLYLWALKTMHEQDTLTAAAALKIGVLCMILTAIGAALLWYSFSSPMIKGRKERL
jgi:hypothetical protein